VDNELVTASLSDNSSVVERGGGAAPAPLSYAEIFWEQFPYYLSIGMTEEQYWDGDPVLVQSYRKAEEYRREHQNEMAWLQGMYVYDAISRLVPVLHAFAKKGAKPKPYTEEPYPITEKKQEDKKMRAEKSLSDKGLARMESFMQKFNKNFKERE
jgi:hypothetical protein